MMEKSRVTAALGGKRSTQRRKAVPAEGEVKDMDQVIFWLVLLIILVVIEIATLGLTTIWFAGGSLIALIAAAFGAPLYLQIALFIVVSAVLLFFTRPLAVRYFNNDRVKTNAESLIGKKAVVEEEIDNLKPSGLVNVKGQDWTARSTQDDVVIPKGKVVFICAISGVKLIVEERKEGE